MIVDAEGAVLGRLATAVAKWLLKGERVDIINADKAIITGDPKMIEKKYLARIRRGSPQHGPFYPRQPHMILRRAIRGMLPYKKPKGRKAYKNLKVYVGIPESLKGKETIKLAEKEVKCNFITLYALSEKLGWSKS